MLRARGGKRSSVEEEKGEKERDAQQGGTESGLERREELEAAPRESQDTSKEMGTVA